MTSFNRYALGAVADWIRKADGGIHPLQPGYAVPTDPAAAGGGHQLSQAVR